MHYITREIKTISIVVGTYTVLVVVLIVAKRQEKEAHIFLVFGRGKGDCLHLGVGITSLKHVNPSIS